MFFMYHMIAVLQQDVSSQNCDNQQFAVAVHTR